jgi:hypothetical protein
MTGKHQHSSNFMDNIRRFNSALAMTSMSAKVYNPPGRGVYTYKIHGQMYHRAGTLHPADGEAPKFAQLYIYDPLEASDRRLDLSENEGCNNDLMKILSE